MFALVLDAAMFSMTATVEIYDALALGQVQPDDTLHPHCAGGQLSVNIPLPADDSRENFYEERERATPPHVARTFSFRRRRAGVFSPSPSARRPRSRTADVSSTLYSARTTSRRSRHDMRLHQGSPRRSGAAGHRSLRCAHTEGFTIDALRV